MFVDWLLASFHHLAVFSLAAILSAEIFLTAGPIDDRLVLRVARVDAWFGILAALVVAAGVLRVFFGAKGYEYYWANIFFWAKMALFIGGARLGRADHAVHRLAAARPSGSVVPPADGRGQAIAPGLVCRGGTVRSHSHLRGGDGPRLRDVRTFTRRSRWGPFAEAPHSQCRRSRAASGRGLRRDTPPAATVARLL
jgi:hypothetical protein